MINLDDYLDIIGERHADAEKYMWDCYGPNAYIMECWNGDTHAGTIVSVVFDMRTRVVYAMEAWEYLSNREYRWIHPHYLAGVKDEYNERGQSFDMSIDDREYIDLETETDILSKAQAIINEESYDTRIQVEIDLSDADKLVLMEMAHERDITLNELVEDILRRDMEYRQATKETV